MNAEAVDALSPGERAMKLFKFLRGDTTPTETQDDDGSSVTLVAPIGGRLVELDEVPDPVFAGRILGDGFAVDPSEGVLRAPFAGEVTSVHAARHAVTLRAKNGAEVLMHIGVDTVGLGGKGFRSHVTRGDRVTTSDPLVTFDAAMLRASVPSLAIPVILIDGDDFVIEARAATGTIAVGERCCVLAPRTATATDDPADATATEVAGEAIVRRVAEVSDPFGMHARPAGIVAGHARAAPVAITVSLGDRRADARSSVSLMLLGARQGDRLIVEAAGPEGASAVDAIVAFVGEPTEDPVSDGEAASTREEQAATVAAQPALAHGEALVLEGVTAAPGQAVGTSRRFVRETLVFVETSDDPARERIALDDALAGARDAVAATLATLGEDDGHGRHGGARTEILTAHLSFLQDPFLRSTADAAIDAGKSAAWAWKNAVDAQIVELRALGNQVLAERATDLEDIGQRVLRLLLGHEEDRLELAENTVLFAEDLLPSQFAELDLDRLAGLCLAASGPTSHVAILAAARGIPAIVATGPNALRVPDGQIVIVEAERARVRINPASDEVAATEARITRRRTLHAEALRHADVECRMADGTRIEVVANLGSLADVSRALANGAEGCGLLRSEFLYLDRTVAPTEDEQYVRYQAIVSALGGRSAIIRTLDAGADKDVPYIRLPTEENPALGLRGIRTSLWQPEILRTQIRALLRIEPYGACRILLPMISTLADLRTVRAVIETERLALGRETPVQIGIMVEVPSAALLAAHFAAEVDFFSIGTNDLTQYALAMDRCNPRLAQQLDPFHPAVLKLIALAVEGARTHGRWVGVCGNLASYPIAAPLLIGLGVTELSAGAEAIPEIKAMVRGLAMERCVDVARAALELGSGSDVRHLLATEWPDL